MVRNSDITIFIKTWLGDLEWLDYTLQSIEKFCPPDIRVVVLGDHDCDHEGITHKVQRKIHGYLYSALLKVMAHQYIDTTYTIVLDSDTVFTGPVDFAQDFFDDDLPIKQYRLCEEAISLSQSDNERRVAIPAYIDSVKRHTGIESRYVFMCQNPYIIRTDTLKGLHELMGSRINELAAFCDTNEFRVVEHMDYLESPQMFSEADAIGAYADVYQYDLYSWRRNYRFPNSQTYWSWGGITDEIQKEIESYV